MEITEIDKGIKVCVKENKIVEKYVNMSTLSEICFLLINYEITSHSI